MDKQTHIIEQCRSGKDCNHCSCKRICEKELEASKGSCLWTGSYEPDLGEDLQ